MLAHLFRATILGCVVAVSAAVVIAGCGGGSGYSGADPAKTKAEIEQIWETFFNGSTGAATRVSLLENGEQFSKEIEAAGRLPLAKQVTADVTSVALDGPTTATVTFTLLVSGSPLLEKLEGSVVSVEGTWKIAAKSFCELAALQGAKPAACPSAG